MVDEVIEHLRHIRLRVDGLTDDMRQVILRLGAVERRVLPKPREVRFLAWPIGNTIVQKNSFAL